MFITISDTHAANENIGNTKTDCEEDAWPLAFNLIVINHE